MPIAASVMSHRTALCTVPIGLACRRSAWNATTARPGSTSVSVNPIRVATGGGGSSPAWIFRMVSIAFGIGASSRSGRDGCGGSVTIKIIVTCFHVKRLVILRSCRSATTSPARWPRPSRSWATAGPSWWSGTSSAERSGSRTFWAPCRASPPTSCLRGSSSWRSTARSGGSSTRTTRPAPSTRSPTGDGSWAWWSVRSRPGAAGTCTGRPSWCTPGAGTRSRSATTVRTAAKGCGARTSRSRGPDLVQELDHRAVEGLGLVAVAEVAGRGEQHEARLLDLLLHHPHGLQRWVLVAAHQQRRHRDLGQPVGDVVHLQQGPEGVGVAHRGQHPVVLEDLLPRARIELDPSRHVGVRGDRELRHRVHAALERDLDGASPHHQVVDGQRQADRGGRVDDDEGPDALRMR